MIERLTLKDFKSFGETTIDLAPFTLAVGANGSGKSNFFDALRFLKFVGEGISIRDAIEGHASVVSADAAISGIRGGAKELVRFGADSREFKLEAVMKTHDDRLSYCIGVNVETYRVVREELKSKKTGSYVFSTHPDSGPLTQDPDSPAISARFAKQTRGLNPRRDFSPHTSILSQFHGRRAESNLNEAIANQVRNELTSITPLELRPDVLRQYAPLGTMEMGEHGEQFAAVLWLLKEAQSFRDEDAAENARQRYEAVKGWLSELTPRAIVDMQTERAPTGEVIFAVREGSSSEYMTARSLSDGTLRFAAMTVALLGFARRGTLLIEEIENGINPARIQLLLNLMNRATVAPEDKQVIASTHSPTVLDLAAEDVLQSTLIFGWDMESESSNVVRMSDLPELKEAKKNRTIGQLQAEGWLQFAADK